MTPLKASGYTVYLLDNSILKIRVHLQMLCSQLEDQQAAPPTQSLFWRQHIPLLLQEAFVLLAPISFRTDKYNTLAEPRWDFV